MSGAARLLVIDECLNKRLVGELVGRGFHAGSVGSLSLRGKEDSDVLRTLSEHHPGCVLVTGDDAMPAEHHQVIVKVGATIATIDGVRPPGRDQDAWERDVVHRWAHIMQRQPNGSIRRYSPNAHRVWVRRLHKT